MDATTHIGEFEQLVLLAVLRQGTEAYALEILQELDERAGRRVARGTLYKTLDRLESKGLIDWVTEESGPERGGHPRRRFRVTAPGVRLLRTSRATLRKMWEGLDAALEGGGA